jgi:hypothetical protein
LQNGMVGSAHSGRRVQGISRKKRLCDLAHSFRAPKGLSSNCPLVGRCSLKLKRPGSRLGRFFFVEFHKCNYRKFAPFLGLRVIKRPGFSRAFSAAGDAAILVGAELEVQLGASDEELLLVITQWQEYIDRRSDNRRKGPNAAIVVLVLIDADPQTFQAKGDG